MLRIILIIIPILFTIGCKSISLHNTPLKILPISDQIKEYNKKISIPITIIDESPESFRFKATSSEKTIVEDTDIKLSGSGSQKILEIAPKSHTGQTIIDLTVWDKGGLSSSIHFTLSIHKSLKIMPIANHQIIKGQENTIPFNVIGGDKNTIQIKAMSSNQNLVRNNDIKISDLEDHKLLEITPQNKTGKTSIIIDVIDLNKKVSSSEFDVFIVSSPFKIPPPKNTRSLKSFAISNNHAIISYVDHDVDRHTGNEKSTISRFESQQKTWILKNQSQWQKIIDLDISDKYTVISYENLYSSGPFFPPSIVNSVRIAANQKGGISKSLNFYGHSLSISKDAMIMKANNSIHIFSQKDKDWIQEKTIPLKGQIQSSSAISENHAIIMLSGQAIIFHRKDNQWIEQAKLIPKDGQNNFSGNSVAISGDHAIIGDVKQGLAYIFERQGDQWIEQAKLIPKDGKQGSGGDFSRSVTISKNHAVISSSTGIYIFKKINNDWSYQIKNAIHGSSDIDISDKYIILGNQELEVYIYPINTKP